MVIETDTGDLRRLDLAYIARHVEHAYALTAHGAQGATVDWAGVIGRPEEFTREWAYTALSRAREQTVIHLIGEQPAHELQRHQYAPVERDRGGTETLTALQRAMTRSESEPLALEQHHAQQALMHARTPPTPHTASHDPQRCKPAPRITE